MAIVRGTTPTFRLTLPETVNLDMVRAVYVTFCRNNVAVTKEIDNTVIERNVIVVSLTQEETLKLGAGTVEIQVNWISAIGIRTASSIAEYEFTRQLLPEVL